MTTSIFDINDMVQQIMAVERAPLNRRIQERAAKELEIEKLTTIESQLNSLKSSMDTLEKASTFQSKTAVVDDTSVLSATPSTGAAQISFEVTVTSLAQAARVQSDSTIFGAGRDATKTTLTGDTVNGSGSFDPNATIDSGSMDLDTGKSIEEGYFILNDATILVNTSDTVNTILTKINNSSAGVEAYYDDDNDQIVIEHKTEGASSDIEMGTDTSGFFDALKLTDPPSTLTQGEDHDLYKDMADTALSGVNSGYFTINRRTFYVDPDNDSLNDIINRVNNSKAGVSLFYDDASDKITMTSKLEGEDILLENDTSGFLSAVSLLDNSSDTDGDLSNGKSTFTGTNADVTINGTDISVEGNELEIHGTKFSFLSTGSTAVKVEANHDTFVSAVNSMVTEYNKTVDTITSSIKEAPGLKRTFNRVLTNIRNLVGGSISNPGNYSYLSNIGLTFSSRDGIRSKLELDESEFRDALDTDLQSVSELFSYDSDLDGLRDDGGVANSLETLIKSYTDISTGFIDERKELTQNTINQMTRRIDSQENYYNLREDRLLESMVRTQQLLQRLQSQLANSQTVRVDFDLAGGKLI